MPTEFTHERFERDDDITRSSDRAFAIVLATVFAVIALFPLVSGAGVRWWSLGIAAAFLCLALIRPVLLGPLNRLWMKFGLLLHHILNPIVMGIIFFGVVTPIGFIVRLSGKDLLRLKLDLAAKTYWIERDPPGPDPQTMKDQF